ncbi:hypothetical protein K474DRAFT_894161 [Panus rudis PR-1116 ss-1]|nr:hypothetical protein K474DRAFT_894161 [Panus rudis PR-1116 ss-1]
MSTLPMDIIETIIYEIYASAAIHRFRNEFLGRYPDGTRWAKGDGTASQCLAACCLISKSCYPRSRYFLYRRIDLAAAKTTAVLIRSLIANPSLGQFIHTLVLWGHTYHDTAICYNAVLSLIGKVPLLHTLVLGNIDLHDVHPDCARHTVECNLTPAHSLSGSQRVHLRSSLRVTPSSDHI